MSIDEIVDELSRYINGIGQRYAGRLRQEVERSFGKWDEKIRIEAPIGEPDEPPAWDGKDKRGRPRATCTNARRALRALGIECRYDVFHDRLIVSSATIRRRSNLDQTVLILRTKLHKAFGFDPGTKNTTDAVVQLCVENEFDPVFDYLNGLQWDGVRRLDKWVVTYLGAADTELNREFGRLALIAAVRRARRPGSKFDPIVVLEGPMGTQKSMAIETLAGSENFSDQTILGARDREAQELLAGVWLYEIAELSNIRRAEVEHIKAFASRTFDRARPAYGRVREDRPRRCVLFATTNNDRYLKEADRRFWPIRTTTIDIEALRRDRDQLWAEAATGEPNTSVVLRRELWDAARVEQEAREDADPWDDKLITATGTKEQNEERISSADLLETVLGIHISKQRDVDYKRLGRCMRRLGWDGPKKVRIGDKETKGYSR
jgi:predicted P-loop ATPase